jgi:formylglycine-generating enzyme required for sulfatase activity
LLIRDDFWLAANRFMRELEIPILENQNCALVDLFDLRHARTVLAAFGQAYGALAEVPADWTREQETFLDRAVASLAQDNKVICVRLALFADMMKDKPWSPATLDQAGGLEGIGEAFLEATFSARSAPAEHRCHQVAARAVLQALLPEQRSEIKGHSQTSTRLRQVSGYEQRPRDFEALLHLLDTKLHLITPTERAGDAAAATTADAATEGVPDRCYQLTHDYLVPSLRAWLTRKQRETRRGRVELCLAERAAWWNAEPRTAHLPTFWEWLTIRLWTSRQRWTATESRMMHWAGQRYLSGAAVLTAVVGLAAWGLLESLAYLRAVHLVDQLAGAPTQEVPALVAQLDGCRRWADPRLTAIVADDFADPRYRIHASLALLPVAPAQLDYLRDQLLRTDLATFLPLREALAPHRAALVGPLWNVVEDPTRPEGERLRAACALASFASADDRQRWRGLSATVARQLVASVVATPGQFAPLVEAVRPARDALLDPLVLLFRDGGQTESERLMTTELLLELAHDRPEVLAEVLMHADAKHFVRVFPAVIEQAERIIPLLEHEVQAIEPPPTPPVAQFSEEQQLQKDRRAGRQANAAIALLRLGREPFVWPLLRHSPEPRVRTYLVHRLGPFGVTPERIAGRLEKETDVSARRALLLSLGECPPASVSAEQRRRWEALVRALLLEHPDPGIHSAAEWLLRQWGQEEQLRASLPRLIQQTPPVDRSDTPRWYVDRQLHTLVVLPGPVDFWMGKQQSKAEKDHSWHKTRIERTFAIATKEVTVAQYHKFLGRPPRGNADLAQGGVNWYDAARYCNWLSKEEGLPPEQWCYVSATSSKGEGVLEAAPDCLTRCGYRLPTEAEWDYACRAGTYTPRFYGHAVELLDRYAWYFQNSDEQQHATGQLLPNDLGLFDTYGNLWEWCHDIIVADGSSQSLRTPRYFVRGGTYSARPWFVHSSFRSSDFASDQLGLIGFRIGRTLPAIEAPEGCGEAPPRSEAAIIRAPQRGGSINHGAWRNQTDSREYGLAGDLDSGGGFRVARTERR